MRNDKKKTSRARLPRSVKSVIDAMIVERTAWDPFCKSLIRWNFVVGSGLLAWGMWLGSGWVTVVGAVPITAQVAVIRYAMLCKREAARMRGMELVLDTAETAEEARRALQEMFLRTGGT